MLSTRRWRCSPTSGPRRWPRCACCSGSPPAARPQHIRADPGPGGREPPWAPGSESFVGTWNGVDYFFQSAEEREQFFASPEQFIPRLHGCDPVAMQRDRRAEAAFVRQYSPQLMNLLTVYAPALTITQSPPHLNTLKDSLLIADGRHTLIRFHRDHARARLIVDDDHECTPHIQRFEEIVVAGGEPLSSSTLGL